jgi:hypothetical protein
MMKLARISIPVLIISICLLSAASFMTPIQVEGQHVYSGMNIPATYRVPGGKLTVHEVDPNIANDYVATLYSDPNSDLTLLVSGANTSPLMYISVVRHAFWLAGHSSEYAVSNPMYVGGYSEFYVAYAYSANTLALVLVKWLFSGSSVTSLSVGPTSYLVHLPANLYETGIDLYWTPDGTVWIVCITQTSVLNMVLIKFVNNNGSVYTTVALDIVQDWCGLITAIGNDVYIWVYGDNFPTEAGRLYDSTGRLLYAASYVATRSSMATLTNGTVAIAYVVWGDSPAIRLIMFNSPSTFTDNFVTNIWTYGVSLYSMAGKYFGFMFTTAQGVFSMYYAQTWWGGWGWSAPQLVARDPSDAYAAQIYADPSGDMMVTNGHPMAWVFFNYASTPFVSYYRLLSIDLFNVHYMSETTTTAYGTTVTALSYNSTSFTSVLQYTVNTGPTVTLTLSKLQTQNFLFTLMIMLGFIVIPALIIGFLGGIIGYSVGALIGAIGARVLTGNMPDWVVVVILLIMAETIVLYRRTSPSGGGEVQTEE